MAEELGANAGLGGQRRAHAASELHAVELIQVAVGAVENIWDGWSGQRCRGNAQRWWIDEPTRFLSKSNEVGTRKPDPRLQPIKKRRNPPDGRRQHRLQRPRKPEPQPNQSGAELRPGRLAASTIVVAAIIVELIREVQRAQLQSNAIEVEQAIAIPGHRSRAQQPAAGGGQPREPPLEEAD